MGTAVPAVSLRPFIDRYVGYRLEGFEPGVHRGLPSRHMTFIVSIGAPIDVLAQTDPAQAPDTYRCVLSGLQASSACIADPGHEQGVAVELAPLGARVLFGDTGARTVGPVGRARRRRRTHRQRVVGAAAVCDELARAVRRL